MHEERRIQELIAGYFELEGDMVAPVLAEFKRVSLQAGDWLFQHGDPGDALYFLVRGRMQAWQDGTTNPDGKRRLLGEIDPGETVGEVALLTGERRTASVLARRDCLLLMIDRVSFERLSRQYPSLALTLASRIAIRMHQRTMHQPTKRHTANICLVPLDTTERALHFMAALQQGLGRHGDTLPVSVDELAACGAPVADWDRTDVVSEDIASWMEDQESLHRFVLYRCDQSAPGWTAYALRQADVIVFVADAATDPALRDWEQQLAGEMREYTAKRTLVLVHPEDNTEILGTAAWLEAREVAHHFHVRDGDTVSTDRVCRIFAGKAVGLVLGAGAARGFAHIGAYRAIVEAGVPIDWIGGSSIGSILGGSIAHNWSPQQLLDKSREAFVTNNPFRDFTIPVISLLAGKKMMEQSRRFLSARIEDLPIPFFCISANLDDGSLNIHNTGRLYDAVQAAAALPVAMPPAVVNGRLALDGAVVNSLPVDLMRQLPVNQIIAVKVSFRKEFEVDYDEMPSPWTLLRSRWLPFGRRYRVPGLSTILLKSIELGTIDRTESLAAQADLLITPPVRQFGMMEVQSFDAIVNAGYEEATRALAGWPALQNRDW
jgi:predicted acylesterase/phospholipase RssA/CRP-like cAMP-binding protein